MVAGGSPGRFQLRIAIAKHVATGSRLWPGFDEEAAIKLLCPMAELSVSFGATTLVVDTPTESLPGKPPKIQTPRKMRPSWNVSL